MTTTRSLRLLGAVLALAGAATAQTKVEVTSKLGTRFYSLPDEKGAIAAAARSVSADPRNPDLLLKLAQAQISVWEDQEAVETLTRALAVSPRNAALYVERGHRELPLREFARAREDLARGASLNPKDMAAYYHLGLAHYFLGEFADAAEAFRHAVDTAPNTDERINSTNWLFAALSRAGKHPEAAKALEAVPPEMSNQAPHTRFYLNLVRFFQGRMSESEALPPEPPANNTDQEVELPFDTVAYGIGNWHLFHNEPASAEAYFRRVLKGHVWITWGFVGAETELARMGSKGR
ncbi:MAG TPA: tetratricopeptide repeat protein [Bryobacteraceae bacterium]|nr:tetratricopeptide repeat protein [Bryobacteraceae bacterium]